MLTKRNIADIIIDDLAGGDQPDDGKFHKQSIYKRIELALNSLMYRSFIEHRNENSYDIDGSFIVPFPNVEVQNDTVRDEKFCDLPQRFVSLPGGRGIRGITTTQEKGIPFIYMANQQREIMSNLEAGGLGGKTSYYIEQNKVFFTNLSNDITNVFIRMIVSIDDLGEDEVIPIPAQYEEGLIEAVREKLILKKETEEDKFNDNKP